MSAKLTLVSFPTCPFVQRAVIALREKKVEFDITYIDLENKPEWFLKISPLGKVPLLRVERPGKPEAVIFESAVILEYLEETTLGVKLHPTDPVERAVHRAWMEFGSTLMTDYAKFTMEKDASQLPALEKALTTKLARLEATVKGPFFAGTQFSNVDAVYAPLLMRMLALETAVSTRLLADFTKLTEWRAALMARPSVLQSVQNDLVDSYLTRLRKYESALLRSAAAKAA